MGLSKNELKSPGVGKMLLNENKTQKDEIDLLKKSLKVNQNELEKLRGKNHELDKANSLLDFQLNTAVIPEFIKFVSSSVGTGFAVSFYFEKQEVLSGISLAASILMYGLVLFLCRKK